MNRPIGSFHSDISSEGKVDFYPFKYGDDMELNELDTFQSGPEPEPKIGSKLDEVFDAFIEDSLFRIFYPQPLKFSPLIANFSLITGIPKKHNIILPKGFTSFVLFGPRSAFERSVSFLQWQKILYSESLLDAGIYTPADLIVDPEKSHRFNRRSVYENIHFFGKLTFVRASRMRVFWRYLCHFSVYLSKEYSPALECIPLKNSC